MEVTSDPNCRVNSDNRVVETRDKCDSFKASIDALFEKTSTLDDYEQTEVEKNNFKEQVQESISSQEEETISIMNIVPEPQSSKTSCKIRNIKDECDKLLSNSSFEFEEESDKTEKKKNIKNVKPESNEELKDIDKNMHEANSSIKDGHNILDKSVKSETKIRSHRKNDCKDEFYRIIELAWRP